MTASETSRKGTIGELAVTQRLIEFGFDVFKEVTGSSIIDLVAYKDKRFFRIQVKATNTSKTGSVHFLACKQHNCTLPFGADDFDVMALYVIDRKEILFAPIAQLLQFKSCMSVRFEPARNGAEKNIRLAKDYMMMPFL